jgi:hypothetical protein
LHSVSDAGGVAARKGFKFQDHVAALFVLDMLGDLRIRQVECETSDDITIKRTRNGQNSIEYVQVKTTDGNSKWSLREITDRSVKSKPTSLIEKSLLCDNDILDASFRIVSSRAPNKALYPLMEPLALRDPLGDIAILANKLQAKYAKTKSPNGRDLDYWTRNTFWEVHPSSDFLEMKNLQAINRLAEDKGSNPTNSHVRSIYKELLEIVEKAASTSRLDPAAKTITQDQAGTWWSEKLAEVQERQRATAKPYRERGDKFFVQIHEFREETSRRYSSGYDAQFERRVWRGPQLARYLADWIPEVSLKASELSEIDQLNLRRKMEDGFKAIRADRNINGDLLLGETLLHAVMRHFFVSEPIACKLFHRSPSGDGVTKNAHIVHTPNGDQLWLGRCFLFRGSQSSEMLMSAMDALADALQTEVLKEERNVILQLREPQHLMANNLDDALDRGAPIDALIEVLCLPILIAYESTVINGGHAVDYQVKLQAEAEATAAALIAALPNTLFEVQVHIFLVPVLNIDELTTDFAKLVGIDAIL